MKILKFYATWCGPCGQLSKNLESFKEQHPNEDVEIVSVNVEENDELVEKYGIRNLPVLIKLSDSGEELSRHVGLLTVSGLEDFILC